MLKRFLITFCLIICPIIVLGQDLPQTADDPIYNVMVPMDGQWMPDKDPIEIGQKNFKTLENMRYRPGGIEGVRGYSKINTTALTTYLKGRSGFHFKKDNPAETHVLYQAYNTGLTASQVLQNTTAIPSQGDFSGTALHTDASGAGLGRFSTGPDGSVAYCNGKESYIWSGDEMPVSGFFTLTQVENPTTYTLTFAADETIVDDGGGNFVTAGYRPGQIIDITGSVSNDRSWTIKKIDNSAATNDRITVIEDAMNAQAGDAGCTLTARIETLGYEDAIDYTEAVNNSLATSDNLAYIGGGIDSNTKLMLHCDGADASTTFTDDGTTGHTATAQGDAQISTAQYKFGGASGYLDGTGDYVSVPAHANFNMADGLFTLEAWIRYVSGNDLNVIFGQYKNATNYMRFAYDVDPTPTLYFRLYVGGSWDVDLNYQVTLNEGQWYHVAAIRGWGGNTNDWALCLNGTAVDTDTNNSTTYPDYSPGTFNIGAHIGGSNYYFKGYEEEIRVSKGTARWIANFTPWTKAYRDSQLQWLLLSTRPLQGLKYYVDSVNTDASTTTGKVWNGASFSDLTVTDGTASGGVSLAQTGSMTFSSTVGEAEPLHFEDAYVYAYLFELSAGQADIYHVTADAPFQPIVNIWDEVDRQPIQFQAYLDGVYEDFTMAVALPTNSASLFGADIDDMLAFNPPNAEHIIVMFEERISALYFTMGSGAEVNTNPSIPNVQYWNGTDWASVGTITDGTSGDDNDWETLGQSGLLSWNPPDEYEEVERTLFGVTGYAYRISVNATLDSTVTIDTVTGIVAQQTVKPFKFPAHFKNRLLLCGYTEGNEGNRIDFSMPNTSDVWNGELSSMMGVQSLYIGGESDLTCATQLYNRYGSNVFAFLLAFKNTETYVISGDNPEDFKIFPVSTNVGCPAPLTLATAEAGYVIAEDITRQIAMWVSSAGPMKFDGGVLSPIPGVETYFDPASSNCITLANIEDARGWYDSTYYEYNVIFPGDSLWLVYDLAEKKWYKKVPAAYLKCGFPVWDTDGTQYIYAGLDTGYMMRLENGNTWDGSGIAQVCETGDFFPTQDPWHQTRIRQFKVAAKDITEAVNLAMTHYADTATSGTSLTVLDLSSGSNRIVRSTQATNLIGWSHRLKFAATTSSTAKGFQPVGWGYQYQIVRDDL